MCWGFPRRRPKFLSTPSARRATISGAEHRAHGTDFYPRPPRGGRRRHSDRAGPGWKISIHALREEGDKTIRPMTDKLTVFLSTPSARRATLAVAAGILIYKFLSTPSARRATGFVDLSGYVEKISIHALREEGDMAALPSDLRAVIFLSTPSARRATSPLSCYTCAKSISIHALREEGDRKGRHCNFFQVISIHALREEGDWIIEESTK